MTVVMINSFRGGTGKSTIVSNLGLALAKHGKKVMILDGDVISPGMHTFFGIVQEKKMITLTDYLLGNAPITDCVYDVSDSFDLPDEHLTILPSSLRREAIAELLRKGSYESILKGIPALQDAFQPDIILMDTHPGLNESMLVTLDGVDAIISILRPDNQDYQGVETYAAIVKKLKLDNFLVVNKIHKKLMSTRLKNTITKRFGLPVAGMFPHSEDLMLSQSKNLFYAEHPDHAFSQAFSDILEEVFDIRPHEHLHIMYTLLHALETGEDMGTIDKQYKHISLKEKKFYLEELKNKQFITQKNDVYSITSKGKTFMKKFPKIRTFVDNFGL